MSEPANRVAPWEDFVLKLIGVYKLLNAAFFAALGLGFLRLRHHDVVGVLNHYIVIPFHLNPADHPNPENSVVDWALEQAQKITPHTLSLFGWAFFFYAALFAVEGVGLYLRKHWAEYLVVIVTGSLLPIEIYEMVHKAAWWKLGVILGNLAIVAYLIHRLVLDSRLRKQSREAAERSTTEISRTGEATAGSNGNSSGSTRAVTTKVP